jgi:hypothetical protein
VFVDEFTGINLNQGCGHAWDVDTNLYVASFGSADVRKFDTQGNYLGVFTEGGHLQGAVNLWFGEDGGLFVVDWMLGSVLRFDGQTGTFDSTFISGMVRTEGVTIGPDGLFYLCDWSRNEINSYDSLGNFVDIFATGGGMVQPNSLVFGPSSQPTSVDNQGNNMPKKFELRQNYPNPFNPSTTIRFSLPRSGYVMLQVFNILGEVVATLANEELNVGTYTTQWNAADVTSGVYFYRLQAGAFVETKKLLLLK